MFLERLREAAEESRLDNANFLVQMRRSERIYIDLLERNTETREFKWKDCIIDTSA